MTFTAQETSEQSGRPVELYAFRLGATYWRYTNHTAAYGLFASATITRGPIRRDAGFSDADLEVRAPRDLAVVGQFLLQPPPGVVLLTVQKVHPADGEVVTLWSGRILACRVEGAEAVFECQSVATSLRRPGLRRVVTRTCPHVLYGTACGATKTGTAATVATPGNPLTLTASLTDHQFRGGTAEFTGGEKRIVEDNTGATVTLAWPVLGLTAGATLTLYRGCAHNLTDCDQIFDNAPRFGGFPYMPNREPTGTLF